MKRFIFFAAGVVTFTAAFVALLLIFAFGGYGVYPVSTLIPWGIMALIACICGGSVVDRYER